MTEIYDQLNQFNFFYDYKKKIIFRFKNYYQVLNGFLDPTLRLLYGLKKKNLSYLRFFFFFLSLKLKILYYERQ